MLSLTGPRVVGSNSCKGPVYRREAPNENFGASKCYLGSNFWKISEIWSQKRQPGNPRPPCKVGLDHEIALNNNYFFRVLKPFAVYVFYDVMRSVRSTSTLQSPCLDIFERCLNFRFSNYAGCAICHVATLKGVQSYWTYGQWRTSAFRL